MQSQIDHMSEIDLGMTNLDHWIDEGLADALRRTPNLVYAQYSGWNFCGYVWFDKNTELFQCEVWQYNQPSGHVAAETLEEIMERVSEEYGYD